MGAPRVDVIVVDKSRVVGSTSTGIFAGLVIKAKKGRSFQPTWIKYDRDWLKEYGNPDPRYSLGHYSGLTFLEHANRLMVVRVHNGAKLAGCSIVLDGSTESSASLVAGIAEDENGITFPAWATDQLLLFYAHSAGVHANGIGIKIDTTVGEADEFQVEVYLAGASEPEETFLVSRTYKLDAQGKQMYIEEMINGKSPYINVRDNTAEAETVMPEDEATAIVLAQGDDGGAVTDADYQKGFPFLVANNENFPVRVLMNGGVASQAFAAAQGAAMKPKRGNALIAVPTSDEEVATYMTDVVAFRNSLNLGANSDHCAMYSPQVVIADRFNGNINLTIPWDGYVAAVHVNTYDGRAWDAPWGTRRGGVDFLKPARTYTPEKGGELDALFDADINSFLTLTGRGTYVWGGKNLLGTRSALSRIDVINLVNRIAMDGAAYLIDFASEKINIGNLGEAKSAMETYMGTVEANEGVSEFEVISDGSNNTDDTIDDYEFHLDVYCTPQKSAERVVFGIIITRSGVDFTEARIASL